ncbi:MAG: hypothetical protein E7173_03510 [Firmicutes bacterium]|nr:hypothetical protein [Bacillota bacterium]
MPYKYAVESICDRISACKTYKGSNYNDSDPLKYWNSQKVKGYEINKCISEFYDVILKDLEQYGEGKVLDKKYLKSQYLICCSKK